MLNITFVGEAFTLPNKINSKKNSYLMSLGILDMVLSGYDGLGSKSLFISFLNSFIWQRYMICNLIGNPVLNTGQAKLWRLRFSEHLLLGIRFGFLKQHEVMIAPIFSNQLTPANFCQCAIKSSNPYENETCLCIGICIYVSIYIIYIYNVSFLFSGRDVT